MEAEDFDFSIISCELDAEPVAVLHLGGNSQIPSPLSTILRTRGSATERDDQSRNKEILEFCKRRGITNLYHFTRIENLDGILSDGLLPRTELDKRPEFRRPTFLDELRLDGNRDASCLSISFPNYKMFYMKRKKSGDDELWAVIEYDFSVITRLQCAFTTNNSASNDISKYSIKSQNTVKDLAELFGDFGTVKRDSLKIPDDYPTNPQAETLVYETVPNQYIKNVIFYSESAARGWLCFGSA